MRKRRMFYILISITLLSMVFAGRLFWLQIVSHTSMVTHSVVQRQKGIVLDSGRGHFVDRYGKPLTGFRYHTLILFPVHVDFRGNNTRLKPLAAVLNVPVEEIANQLHTIHEPMIWKHPQMNAPQQLNEEQVMAIDAMNLPFVQTVSLVRRYDDQGLARHLIGYISEHPERIEQLKQSYKQLDVNSRIGAAGLEKTLDRYLTGIGPTTLSLYTDAQQRPIKGLGYRMTDVDNPFYPVKVETTLDQSLQLSIEQAMDKLGVNSGAVVVLDTEHSNVLAMASRPQFDPADINPSAANWNNQAMMSAAPGSVYKLLIAAVALEEKHVDLDETFFCGGSYGKFGFSCWKEGGHGHLSFEEAFAQSCNIAFAQIALRLDPNTLEQYASKLGLLEPVGWSDQPGHGSSTKWAQLDNEHAGQLFAPGTPRTDEGVLIQTAIGQRDVRISPLQAANFINTLLHGGVVSAVKVIEAIKYENGSIWVDFDSQVIREDIKLSRATIQTLRRFMEKVVESGTGQLLQQAAWPVAGKSGTAQVESKGSDYINQWFVGYAPASQPQYSIAVLVSRQEESAQPLAIPLFKEVVNVLEKQSDGS